MERVIMFGAAGGGKRLLLEVQKKYDVVAFVDNDEGKWNCDICGIPIMSPDNIIGKLNYDYIIISSAPGLENIRKQCVDMGVAENIIITKYVTPELEGRIIFLKKLSEVFQKEEQVGAIAEAGVFEGDFAKYMNKYFPDKDCYLFDTFEGFDVRDINVENEMSKAVVGEYSNTSVEQVMAKMEKPDRVKVFKGYFPESATDVEEEFCFVNLDLDLYEPTYQGLLFFEKKMAENGCILVHDYFAENFKGPRNAVDKFLLESKEKLRKFPIGDGISIMICGF